MKNRLVLIESASFSYPKSEGEINEDSVLSPVTTKDSIFIALADGVGGSAGGSIAADVAISTVRNIILERPEVAFETIFDKVLNAINNAADVFPHLSDMATTLVVCKISAGKLEVASVGDSRAYVIEGNSLKKLTTDHTKKQELIDSGVFKNSELRGHYSGSVLTNSLRAFNSFKLDVVDYKCNGGVVFLVSDGVYRFFEGARVVGNNGAGDLIQMCGNIKRRVFDKGPKDDFSLVAISYKAIN